jgi:predicted transcriptional regulator YdeE
MVIGRQVFDKMKNKTSTYQCEMVKKEFTFVGISVTVPFPSAFPQAALKVQQDFEKRIIDISNPVNHKVLISPFICNGIIATYFACLEVSDLRSIPEGMIGFTVLSTEYAKITCTNRTIGEGYNEVFRWMGENGYTQKGNNAFQMEVYYIDELAEEEKVELLIPIES